MSDLLLSMKTIFTGSWKMLSSINIPGTDFSFAALFVGLIMVSIGFRTLSMVLGWSVPGFTSEDWQDLTRDNSSSPGVSYHSRISSNASNPRISDARKHDEI